MLLCCLQCRLDYSTFPADNFVLHDPLIQVAFMKIILFYWHRGDLLMHFVYTHYVWIGVEGDTRHKISFYWYNTIVILSAMFFFIFNHSIDFWMLLNPWLPLKTTRIVLFTCTVFFFSQFLFSSNGHPKYLLTSFA